MQATARFAGLMTWRTTGAEGPLDASQYEYLT